MEACLNYCSKCSINETKQFEFEGKSGSKWTLIEEWAFIKKPRHHIIKIQRESRGTCSFYYADLEIYTFVGSLLLKRCRKGSPKIIEFRIDFKDVLDPISYWNYESNPKLFALRALNETFLYKIKIFPVLELRNTERVEQESLLPMRVLQTLIRDVSTLSHDPALDFLHDIMVVSDTVVSKAHTNILSVRLSAFCDKLCQPLQHRKQDGLKMIRLGPLAAPGLNEIMLYTYTNEYSSSFLSNGRLSLAAKEIGEVRLLKIFLDKLLNMLDIDNALYVISVMDRHVEKKYCKKALSFLQCHFAQVAQTPQWDCLMTFFVCLSRANERICSSGSFSRLQILKFSLYMLADIYYK